MNMAQVLLNQIKIKNPQMFNKINEMMKNNNPQDMLNQLTSNYTPEQMNNFIKYANGFGITNEQLNKYGINSK